MFIKRFRDELDNDEKMKILPYLVKNVIHPYGYTFLSYLVYENKTQFIKAALEVQGVKYFSDINGTTPLQFAI